MSTIKVMIVEDSRVVRRFLEHIISGDPRLEVISSVETAEEALRSLHRVEPDVISMDVHLPGMNGVEATRRIMEEKPTPIVVVSGSLQSFELRDSMNALKAGALAVVEKPVGATHDDYAALAERLCTQLAIMSQVKVIRQRFNGRGVPSHGEKPRLVDGAETAGGKLRSPRVIGMVASTGGPKALQSILGGLPAGFSVPIVLDQHFTANVHPGFVEWLDHTCPLSVVTAEHQQTAAAGHVYVAPPDCHLLLNGRQFLLRQAEPVCNQRPSGTVLLQSMADSLKHSALGIVLTGMGDDGAEGLLDIRKAGGHTIAEDASTAVVYGMPAAAARLGAACEQLPLEEIAPRMLSLVYDAAEVG